MSEAVELVVDSEPVLVPVEALLFALASWLVRRNGSELTSGMSIATSRTCGSMTATIEVHRTSEEEVVLPALSVRNVSENL
jgi:hypothetical protein